MMERNTQRTLPLAKLVTLRDLFNENRSFFIPDYQRPYDWGTNHREDLLRDIDKLALLTERNADAVHFCGTVICTPHKKSQDVFAIVDGQQRLTTLALLHARLCRASGKQTFLSQPGSIRFMPQSQDEGAFTAILNGGSPGQSTTLAQANYLAADKEIEEWLAVNNSSADRLLKLLENHIKFIFFVLADENEVAKVFETINTRGKPLTQMDLVKNHLIYLSAVNNWSTPNINEVWRQIQQIAGSDRLKDADVDAVLRATVTAQFRPGRRNAGETDFKVVTEKLHEKSTDYNDFKTFVDFLRANFQTYLNLRYARRTDPNDPTTRVMTYLNHHDSITGVLPLIFARQYRRDDDRSDAPVLTAIEKTNFRLYGLPNMAPRSDSHNVRLHKLAHDYFNRKKTDQDLIADLTSLVSKGPRDGLSTIVDALTLNDDDGFDFFKWPWRRYFLARFEESLLDRQSFDFDRLLTQYGKSGRTNDYLSVEHIWPKNAEDTTVAAYRKRQQIRRLGNLMLLPHGLNITLSNNTPEVKQTKMNEAKITMLRQNRILEDIVTKAEKFVEILQNRDDERFGADRSRFYKKTIEKNGTIALVKTICDLREEAMVSFALKEWRLPGEPDSGNEFAGIFSFAHSEEAFFSDRETPSNKAKENYVLVQGNTDGPVGLARLRARNDALECGIVEPVRWT